jgi:hypothetical protein
VVEVYGRTLIIIDHRGTGSQLADAQFVVIGSIWRRDWLPAVESTIAQLGS